MSSSRKMKTRVSGRSNGPQLYGYTDTLSVAPGEQIGFHVSTNVSKYDMEIARIGAERQIVWSKDDLPGAEYPIPGHASSHGCRWPQAFKLTISKSWPSGYYGALLHGHDAEGRTAQGELCFVVRSAQPGRDTSILLQRTTNTDNAYNSWGGTTLYNGPAVASPLIGRSLAFLARKSTYALLEPSLRTHWTKVTFPMASRQRWRTGKLPYPDIGSCRSNVPAANGTSLMPG